MPEDNAIFELSDIEVDTLGLVSRGANREDFFMLKSDNPEDNSDETINKDQMQEADQSEMETKITQNIWQKLIGLFKKAAKEPEVLGLETESITEKEGDATTTDTEIRGETPEETVKEETTTVEETVEPTTVSTLVEQPADNIEETVKGEDTMPEDVISKAEFEKTQAELTEIRKELDAARQEKEQLVWVNKANGFGYAPVASTELAQHLYKINKLDANEANWLVDLLKAYDAMLGDSGLFVEKGRTILPIDEVEKAVKAENPREALLSVDRKTAEEYLERMREVSRR